MLLHTLPESCGYKRKKKVIIKMKLFLNFRQQRMHRAGKAIHDKMPGLPTRPGFYDVDIDPHTGKVIGLF